MLRRTVTTLRAKGVPLEVEHIVPRSSSLSERTEQRSGQPLRQRGVLPGTGGSDSMEHGRRQKTIGDRDRAGCTHVVAPALHSG